MKAVVLCLVLAVACAAPLSASDREILVLTELPPLYSITASLAAGTGIAVKNVPADGRRMNALARYLEKPEEANLELFRRADAVVTMGKLWREAPLYAAVRAQNIHVVNIDATEPYSATLPGVALLRSVVHPAAWEPVAQAATGQETPVVYFWLSLSNGVRAGEIIADDLIRLAPADRQRISRNLADYRRALFALRGEYEAKLAAAGGSLFALAQEFDYLTGDLGLFVEGYFVKQDVDWTAEDLRQFANYLRERQVTAVIHKWQPSDAIQQAIRAAGASLAVLNTQEEGVVAEGALSSDGYIAGLRANLEALHRALSRPPRDASR